MLLSFTIKSRFPPLQILTEEFRKTKRIGGRGAVRGGGTEDSRVETWPLIRFSPLTSCMPLGKLFNIPGSSHKMGMKTNLSVV